MKKIWGFRSNDEEAKEAQAGGYVKETPADEPTKEPVRSLVQVRFPHFGKALTYYNDQFALKVGDMVYVSGKLAGELGTVESVNTRFKIDLADYERVIAHPVIELHGRFTHVLDRMLCYDPLSLTADQFRSWVKAPVIEDEDEDEPQSKKKHQIIMGEGYSFALEKVEYADEVDVKIIERAYQYLREGRIRYLSLVDGIGTAFVEGTSWYEVNFKYADGVVTDLYCECPYPALCKHNLAVMVCLRALLKNVEQESFISLDDEYFWQLVLMNQNDITIW